MNRALWYKAVREGVGLWVACAIGVFSFCLFRVWIVGRLDSARFKQIIDLLPKEWDRFSSVDFSWMVSYLGRVVMTLDEPMVVMLLTVWAVARGSDVVSGELNRGTLEMLLAQPVSRRSVFTIPTLINLSGVVGLSLVAWWAMAWGVSITTIKESVYPTAQIPFWGKVPLMYLEPRQEIVRMSDVLQSRQFWPGIVNLACLGVFWVGLSSLISALDRYRWRTLGILVAIYFAMAMLKIGGLSVDFLRWMLYGSIFSLYEPELHIRLWVDGSSDYWSLWRWNAKWGIYELGPWGSNAVLAGAGVLCLWVGLRRFRVRDLAAPL